MKTTLEIPDPLMRRLKERAAREKKTMSELVEGALRTLLAREEGKPKDLPPLPSWDGGGWLVDPADREALYELFDADDPLVQEMATWSREK